MRSIPGRHAASRSGTRRNPATRIPSSRRRWSIGRDRSSSRSSLTRRRPAVADALNRLPTGRICVPGRLGDASPDRPGDGSPRGRTRAVESSGVPSPRSEGRGMDGRVAAGLRAIGRSGRSRRGPGRPSSLEDAARSAPGLRLHGFFGDRGARPSGDRGARRDRPASSQELAQDRPGAGPCGRGVRNLARVGIGSPGGSRGCFPVGPPRIGRTVRRSSRSTRRWPSPRAWPMS